MIEGFAREMPEDRMLEAICARPTGIIREICDLQQELIAKVGVARSSTYVPPPTTACYDRLQATLLRRLQDGQADRRQAGPGRRRRGT